MANTRFTLGRSESIVTAERVLARGSRRDEWRGVPQMREGVRTLGHIFEQSITDLEKLKKVLAMAGLVRPTNPTYQVE
jgi:hypothetical protein